MTPRSILAILIPIAYLLGSIPFGLVVGRMKGIDPRKAGSGNIGATNVGRLLGKRFFVLVFTLDLLKSFVPMFLGWLAFRQVPPPQRDTALYGLWLGIGCAAIVGHLFSIFLGFRGGKGVATSAGVLLGLIPYYTLPGLLAIAVFIAVFKISGYVSLGSMIGVSSFPLFYLVIGYASGWPIFREQLPLLIAAVAMAALIIWRHRTNIQRLLAGTEHRSGRAPQ